jgi:SPP1 family predicted phage head-tail adaptor
VIAFIDPGLLRRRAVLQAAELVPDESGGAVTAWHEVAEVSVHVEPVSVAVGERFSQNEVRVTHRVTCRARGDVERGMAFAIGNRRLLVRAVQDPDESGRYLVCRCEEER